MAKKKATLKEADEKVVEAVDTQLKANSGRVMGETGIVGDGALVQPAE